MSIETGCWLFVAAAHPQGGERMVSFSSEKLRLEGLTELNSIVNDFSVLMARMTTARRTSSMELQRNLENERQARIKAEEDFDGLRSTLQDNVTENERLRAELARFEKLRALLPMEEYDSDEAGDGDDDLQDPL